LDIIGAPSRIEIVPVPVNASASTLAMCLAGIILIGDTLNVAIFMQTIGEHIVNCWDGNV